MLWRHKVALGLGCTLSELGERLSSAEYLQWIAYYRYWDRKKNAQAPLLDDDSQLQYDIAQMQRVLN